ncbi:hypothetical protein SprV_0802531000 [Sparganum proliferum]
MRWTCLIFMLGTCWAVVYNVGEKTKFYRFEMTPRITKITASTPTIKTRNCGSKDFCLEVYEGKRAAIVRGTVYENVSAVIFYGRQRKTPHALVIRTKAPPSQNKTAPKLPSGTKVRDAVEVDRGTKFDYLAIFDDDLEKIEVTGDVQVVTAGPDNSDLHVYSPLYAKGAEDAQFILVNGYIEQKKMAFNVQFTTGHNETFTFNPNTNYGSYFWGYSNFHLNSMHCLKPLYSFLLLMATCAFLFR